MDWRVVQEALEREIEDEKAHRWKANELIQMGVREAEACAPKLSDDRKPIEQLHSSAKDFSRRPWALSILPRKNIVDRRFQPQFEALVRQPTISYQKLVIAEGLDL